ncbi:VQ motif-containing protein 8, chloroplastic-like [Gastrolobium bilobum]|uniref:VQ motif-containing protein 8, chloroplastic-like n=1 Tax=Gastrolobium bilobum TaxID=150636 RepID=UPI002AB00B88|nr:VQ motif-containing protein 8, chloroplastic-like [Gastrolobium bilobum]
MRPVTKFNGFHEQPKKVINGARPSSLLINKDSHLIRKPSVSSTNFVAQNKHQKVPIIIYTQSPKVIHTKPQDFMALVQRLTGKSSTNGDVSTATTVSLPHQPNQEASLNSGSSLSDVSNNKSIKLKWMHQGASDGDETNSALRRDDKTCVKGGASFQHSPSNLDFADMPLFTPNSSVVYKYSDSPFGILGSLISPSGLEFMKELPEY